MIDQLTSLIRKEKKKDLLALLKSLDAKQKKELVPGLKKLNKLLSEFKADRFGHYRTVGSEQECELALTSSFVCMNQADFEKTFAPYSILDTGKYGEILDWYCPHWFSDFVNRTARNEFIPYHLSYERIMQLHTTGYLQPNPELLAKQLVNAIFKRDGRVDLYTPEVLEIYPETLQEHIWYLFEFETDIHYSNRWMNFKQGLSKEKTDWITTINTLCSAGKLDRFRIIKESILASNKNFNKVLSGFFCELAGSFDPSAAEILALQKEIFSSLSSVHSKPVNTALQLIKKIVTLKEFDAAGFMDYVPALISSNTKSVIASCIMILEKLGKKNKELQASICNQLLPVFIVADNDVQTRAAKLLQAFSGSLEPGFREELLTYESGIMSCAKPLLQNLLSSEKSDSLTETTTASDIATLSEITTLQPIQYPDSFDDFVFFASQAFDNNQSWHLDVLASEIIRRWPLLQKDNIDKLEPALQRALKMTKSEFRAGQGWLDHMLAIFFIDVCILLVRREPANAMQLQKMFASFDQKNETQTSRWLSIEPGAFYLRGWKTYTDDSFYQPYKLLLLSVLEKLGKHELSPLLSTPTHEPAWIDPVTLVHRIVAYEKNKQAAIDIDFQIAVSRCYLQQPAEAIALAKQLLPGEYLKLVLFLLGHTEEPQAPFHSEAVWICASLARPEKRQYVAFAPFQAYKKPFSTFTGLYPWQAVIESYQEDTGEWKNGQWHRIKRTAYRKLLKLERPSPAETSVFKGVKKLLSGFKSKPAPVSITFYEFIESKSTFFSADADVRRIFLLSPNNPGPMLALMIRACLQNLQYFSEPEKRGLVAVLQALHESWQQPGETGHIFIAACLLSADKTVLNLAGEIWLHGVSHQSIDSAQLGSIMGKLEAIEFAPLKRFTDHALNVLFRVSHWHNQQLQLLIENLLAGLPAEPIKNLKKLLEIYLELLTLNSSKPPAALEPVLQQWEANAGLKKLVEKMK